MLDESPQQSANKTNIHYAVEQCKKNYMTDSKRSKFFITFIKIPGIGQGIKVSLEELSFIIVTRQKLQVTNLNGQTLVLGLTGSRIKFLG
jgi:hypothetical protein